MVVLVDVFTRFVDAKPVMEDRSLECALFLREFYGRFGPLEQLVPDNGLRYVNNLVNDTLQVFGVARRHTANELSKSKLDMQFGRAITKQSQNQAHDAREQPPSPESSIQC